MRQKLKSKNLITIKNYVRSSVIERVRDPKPILSQTGSPFLPGNTANFNQTRSSVKRYRPTHTVPILSALHHLPQTQFEPNYDSHHQHPHPQPTHVLSYENTNFTAMPYHDKRMVNQIQKSLNRAVHHAPPTHYTTSCVLPISDSHAYPYGATQSHSQLPASQQQYATYEPHQCSSFGLANKQSKNPLPKVVNLQYNTPLGLYSANNVKEELLKKIG